MASSERLASAGERRQELLDGVLSAAKSCQSKFGKKTELATSHCDTVTELCSRLELILQHGLRPESSSLGLAVLRNVKDLVSNSSNTSEAGGVWRVVRTVLNRHEFERFSGLKCVTTDIGRGRAWLRAALNEQSLEKYFNILLGDEIRLREFYEDWAFMRDKDRTSLLPSIAGSLCSIRFALKLDTPDINGDDNSISASLTNLLPASLKPVPALGEATVAVEAPQEVVITTARLRSKKKKKVRSYEAPISDKMTSGDSEEPDSGSGVTLSSPFTSHHADTDQLTAKLNSLLKTKEDKTNTVPEHSNIDLVYDAVDLSNVYKEDDKIREEANDFYTESVEASPVKKEQKPVNTESLIPVANKSIGGLFPVLSSRASILSEDTQCPGDDHLDDSTDYAAPSKDRTPSKSDDVSCLSREDNESVQSGSSIKQNDLKQALLSVMEKKTDLEQQVTAMKKLLDQEINHVAEAKQELNDIKQIHKEKLEKMEARNSILARENELLKHQLKKYVGAVQKLRDGPQAYETLAQLEGIRENENKKYIDYHYEASEYEKKLIQVAEMHGELLEFNENLQKSIQGKDLVISRLRDELIALRGPLPEDEDRLTDPETASVCSFLTDSSIGTARVLVNIWIPSVFLSGSGSSRHHVYQVGHYNSPYLFPVNFNSRST